MTRSYLAVLVTLLLLLLGFQPGQADDDKARATDAYVVPKVALARVGPGIEFYPTDALPRGDRVEVIERRESWVGIRPPSGSISWIDASRLTPLAAPEAQVQDDDTPVWVGSSVTSVEQHESQVHLRRGERVEILAEKTVKGASGEMATWLKITPPVGELRWVRADELSDVQPAAPSPPGDAAISPQANHPLDSREQKASPRGAEGKLVRTPQARKEIDDSLVWVDRQTGRSGVAPVRDPFALSEQHRQSYSLEGRTFDDQLTILHLKTARAAARGATRDEVARLRGEVEDLVRSGATAYERGRASLLLDRVRELGTITERRADSVEPASHERLPEDDRLSEDSRGMEAEVRPAVGDKTPSDEGSESPYVASGWLMPVTAPGKTAPPFVLMDTDGQPVAFVTPAPGLNLRRYIDQEVGIVGEPSFTVLDRKHVVAHRAVDLSRHRGAADDKPRPTAPWIRFRRNQDDAH